MAERRKRVTIYDVAAAAGVAPSTVSRAFSRPGRVHADTAELVIETAQRLGYRTKPAARSELGVATWLLAFVVADAANPVFSHILKGIQMEASQHGYTVLLVDSQEDPDQERDSIQRVLPLVDGVVLGASRLSDSAINQVVKVRPVVSVNRIVAGIPSIVADTQRGMHQAVAHLAQRGHTQFTYLSGPSASWSDGMRWRAVSQSCQDLGLTVRQLGPFAPTLEGGVTAAHEWLETPTSAVIAYNDAMAIGFMKTVQRRGLAVPGDVSLVGVDNSISSVLTTPALSTVAPSASQIGVRAARALISQLRHRSTPSAETIVVPMELFARESIGPTRSQEVS